MNAKNILSEVESDLAPIKARIVELSMKYTRASEWRVGYEIFQATRALDEAAYLAGVYMRERPLPSMSGTVKIAEYTDL